MFNKVLSFLAVSIVTVSLLGACSNTLTGIGQDIENSGEKIQETVE